MNIVTTDLKDYQLNLWNAISFLTVYKDRSSTLKDKCDELNTILNEGRRGIDFASFADLVDDLGSRQDAVDHFFHVCSKIIRVDFFKAIEYGFIPEEYKTIKFTGMMAKTIAKYC